MKRCYYCGHNEHRSQVECSMCQFLSRPHCVLDRDYQPSDKDFFPVTNADLEHDFGQLGSEYASL